MTTEPGREWGVRYTTPDHTFTAGGYTQQGAQRMAESIHGRGWSAVSVSVVWREVSEWQNIEEGLDRG